MNYGQGAITFVNKQSGGGGGGTVIGARNGTSDVANFVELGGNPLLHFTSFDVGGFVFDITGKGGGFDMLLLIDFPGSELAQLETSGANSMGIIFNDVLNIAKIFQNPLGIDALSIDFANGFYQLGDVTGSRNGTQLSISDSAQTADFLQAISSKDYLHIDFGLNTMDIGDHSGIVNGYKVSMDIANRDFAINDTAGLYVDFFTGAGQYNIGDLSNLVSGMKMNIDVTGNDFQVEGSLTNQRLLALSVSTGDYSIGDLDGIANTTRMIIRDSTQRFDFETSPIGVIGTFRLDGLQTTDPTGGITTHKAWQFGDHVAAVVAFDAANYLEVNVNGAVYKVALCT